MRVSLKLNILIVMQFSGGGGGYMEQDKAHTPTPRKSWSSVQMSLGNLY